MATIAELNDAFRKKIIGIVIYQPVPGVMTHREQNSVVITQGVYGFCRNPANTVDLLQMVQDYDDFSEDNDPYDEHDFGSFTWSGKSLYFKIDYYDLNYEYASEDASNPDITRRVLTILLAEEY
jgi:hypothetical protein